MQEVESVVVATLRRCVAEKKSARSRSRGAGRPCAGRATAHEKRMGNRDPADGRGEDLREEDRRNSVSRTLRLHLGCAYRFTTAVKIF